jgi:SAM-dependent methyltransferase
MTYDNSHYWQQQHRGQAGRLATVGYPHLSESFNQLKYDSEAETVLAALSDAVQLLPARSGLRVLDVGAGTGYWTQLVQQYFEERELAVQLTALDISREALEGIRSRQPQVTTAQHDLKTIAADQFERQFDIVYSFYCLHHLPRIDDFIHALRFCGRSVVPGGLLLIMDPVLTLPYSRFAALEFSNHAGNGTVRHLHMIDDVLDREGLQRVDMRPAVSFVLNSGIEARSEWTYGLRSRIWQTLQYFYRSERRTHWIARAIRQADRWCKKHKHSYSSSLCVFRRQPA